MINRAIIVGRLVRDPELRKTGNGTSVVAFTVAVDNRPSKSGEKSTSFIPCTAWNMTAENVAKYCHKGSLVGIDGRINQRNYENKEAKKVSVVELICDSVQFLEKRGDSSSQGSSNSGFDEQDEPSTDSDVAGISATDDDLPF